MVGCLQGALVLARVVGHPMVGEGGVRTVRWLGVWEGVRCVEEESIGPAGAALGASCRPFGPTHMLTATKSLWEEASSICSGVKMLHAHQVNLA